MIQCPLLIVKTKYYIMTQHPLYTLIITTYHKSKILYNDSMPITYHQNKILYNDSYSLKCALFCCHSKPVKVLNEVNQFIA